MLVKLTGILLIAAGAGGSVHVYLRLCRSRIRSLRSIAQMLELMQGELETSALPLAQLLEAIAPRLDDPALLFSKRLAAGMAELGKRSFSEIWTSCLCACFSDLGSAELQALKELGSVLGRYELSCQTEALLRCRRFLKQREETAAAALAERRRLALGLALTGTAMLGVILF